MVVKKHIVKIINVWQLTIPELEGDLQETIDGFESSDLCTLLSITAIDSSRLILTFEKYFNG